MGRPKKTPAKSAKPSVEYKPGDLVFCKIKGFPPWPARVDAPKPDQPVPKNKYLIFFYGSHEICYSLPADIFPYHENKAKLGYPRPNKSFNEAMWEIENTPDVQPADSLGKGALQNDVLNATGSGEEEESKVSDTKVEPAHEDHNESLDTEPLSGSVKKSSVRPSQKAVLKWKKEPNTDTPKRAKKEYIPRPTKNRAVPVTSSEESVQTEITPVSPLQVPVKSEDTRPTVVAPATAPPATLVRQPLRDGGRVRKFPPYGTPVAAKLEQSQPAVLHPSDEPGAVNTESAEHQEGDKRRRSIRKGKTAISSRKEELPGRNGVKHGDSSPVSGQDVSTPPTIDESTVVTANFTAALKKANDLFAADSDDEPAQKKRRLAATRSQERAGVENKIRSKEGTYVDEPAPPDPEQSSSDYPPDVKSTVQKSQWNVANTYNERKRVREEGTGENDLLRDFQRKRDEIALKEKPQWEASLSNTLLVYEVEIKKALRKNHFDIDMACEVLLKVLATPLYREVLLKTPTFVDTVRRTRKFSGKEPGSDRVRDIASQIYQLISMWFPSAPGDTSGLWERYLLARDDYQKMTALDKRVPQRLIDGNSASDANTPQISPSQPPSSRQQSQQPSPPVSIGAENGTVAALESAAPTLVPDTDTMATSSSQAYLRELGLDDDDDDDGNEMLDDVNRTSPKSPPSEEGFQTRTELTERPAKLSSPIKRNDEATTGTTGAQDNLNTSLDPEWVEHALEQAVEVSGTGNRALPSFLGAGSAGANTHVSPPPPSPPLPIRNAPKGGGTMRKDIVDTEDLLDFD